MEGLHEGGAALVFSVLHRDSQRPLLWLCRNNREAERTAANLRFFFPSHLPDPVLVVPGSEADPYRGLSPHPEISARRAMSLWRLLEGFDGIVVTTPVSLATRMASPRNFLSQCLRLEPGNFLPREHLFQRLREMGYVREDPVSEVGEYSYRGGIVDIYSPSRLNPVRVEFFGDEIESIREFNAASQRSVGLVSFCDVVPTREWVVTEREIQRWHEQAPEYWNEVRFAQALEEKRQFTENGELFNGFEYLLPLVLNTSASLLDYFREPESLQLVLPEPEEWLESWSQMEASWQQSFQERHQDGELVLPPEKLFFPKSWLTGQLARRPVFYLKELALAGEETQKLDFLPERKYHGRIQEVLADLQTWRRQGQRVIFVMASRGMAERLVDIFKEYEVFAHFAQEGFEEALGHPLSVTFGKLSQGFHSPSLGLHLLTQEDVFEESQLKPAVRKSPSREAAARFLSDFRDLKKGDYVVHVEHGIGIFGGLQQLGVEGDTREFVVLLYQGGAKLYVPIDRLDLIQKYSGGGAAPPRIDRLGGTSWERTKSRIKKSMRVLAEDLLQLYARREMARGHAFPPDDELMQEFEEAFEFEETPDQAAAIADVKRDMESPRPMDRLICGDVGYGKTEVAMRAAFKAVSDNKQVAVLAPTTVLAFQHFNTFRERFQAFPVRIEMISRFRSREEQKEILEAAALGSVDILIGTHRLLSRDVRFADLGLVVIDEEQRFGVAQKEKLKKLKTQVDVLTLSATPIPRTLNLSLIGIRDLSIIETPPKDRLAIQTVVVRFGRNIIRSAIDLELKRQGQVFFVHNSVESIYAIARMVQETVPEARVAVAHGQMREAILEEVMLEFLDYKYDVLVCTTIIENGLDIPRANTMIVNQADRFGLAQLYQLRGRVGRSSRRAYAYLLISSEETLSSSARKRLAAIRDFSDLGAGFRVAALDLEIRGAGNILGGEQHGHISAVGFELYVKLLEQTIRELKGEEVEPEVQTSVDLHLDIQIPKHYIDDPNLRLWLYKRISTAADEQALEHLRDEVIDRFGKYPRSVSNLFEYARLRLKARTLKILSMERKAARVFLRFRHDTPVSTQKIIDLVQRNGRLTFTPEGLLAVHLPSARPQELFAQLHAALDEIGEAA